MEQIFEKSIFNTTINLKSIYELGLGPEYCSQIDYMLSFQNSFEMIPADYDMDNQKGNDNLMPAA